MSGERSIDEKADQELLTLERDSTAVGIYN